MDCILAGGTYTRTESGVSVTYKKGEPLRVTRDEIAAFPNKFIPVVTPRDEEKEASLEASVQTLTLQVEELTRERDELKESKGPEGTAALERKITTLTRERGEARKAAEELEDDLKASDQARTEAEVNVRKLAAENESLRAQLEQAQTPASDPELKVNEAETSSESSQAAEATGTSKKK